MLKVGGLAWRLAVAIVATARRLCRRRLGELCAIQQLRAADRDARHARPQPRLPQLSEPRRRPSRRPALAAAGREPLCPRRLQRRRQGRPAAQPRVPRPGAPDHRGPRAGRRPQPRRRAPAPRSRSSARRCSRRSRASAATAARRRASSSRSSRAASSTSCSSSSRATPSSRTSARTASATISTATPATRPSARSASAPATATTGRSAIRRSPTTSSTMPTSASSSARAPRCGSSTTTIPGQEAEQAIDMTGMPYMSLPNALKYRREFDATCSCKQQINYGRSTSPRPDGQSRAVIDFNGLNFPLPLRDPRRHGRPPLRRRRSIQAEAATYVSVSPAPPPAAGAGRNAAAAAGRACGHRGSGALRQVRRQDRQDSRSRDALRPSSGRSDLSSGPSRAAGERQPQRLEQRLALAAGLLLERVGPQRPGARRPTARRAAARAPAR